MQWHLDGSPEIQTSFWHVLHENMVKNSLFLSVFKTYIKPIQYSKQRHLYITFLLLELPSSALEWRQFRRSLKTTPFTRSQEGNQHQNRVQRLHHKQHNSGARLGLKQRPQQLHKKYPNVHLPHGFCCLCSGKIRLILASVKLVYGGLLMHFWAMG